jgi:MOSC domain-containing protein YiiM
MQRTLSPEHRSAADLEAGLAAISSPFDAGRLEMIVRRPALDSRERLQRAELDADSGLVGDTWRARPSSHTPDRSPHPGRQLTMMNSRVAALLAGDAARWPLAGDQLYVDLDLSEASLPPGTQLAIGDSVIEITPESHTGCGKFVQRFGLDAMKLVNSPRGRQLRLRGIYARVVQPGSIEVGGVIRRLQNP